MPWAIARNGPHLGRLVHSPLLRSNPKTWKCRSLLSVGFLGQSLRPRKVCNRLRSSVGPSKTELFVCMPVSTSRSCCRRVRPQSHWCSTRIGALSELIIVVPAGSEDVGRVRPISKQCNIMIALPTPSDSMITLPAGSTEVASVRLCIRVAGELTRCSAGPTKPQATFAHIIIGFDKCRGLGEIRGGSAKIQGQAPHLPQR